MVDVPNSASVDLSYTYGQSNELVESQGATLPNINIVHHNIALDGTYVTPMEGLAVDVGIPIVGTKYDPSGIEHFPEPSPRDNGSTHFSVTDLRAGLRYQFLREPLAASVALAGTLPLTDYPTDGFTAPGHGLKALHGKLSLGRLLHPFLPKAYVHGSYEFSLVERVDEGEEVSSFNRNRSDFAFLAGYFILDDLEANLAVDYRRTHGGMDFIRWDDYSENAQLHHDRLLRENILLIGGGVNYQLTDAISLGGAVRLFTHGTNTRNAHLFALLASYQIN